MRIALVRFQKGSFNQEYAYKTNIENLDNDDLVVVPTGDCYSVAIFNYYSDDPKDSEKATKYIVCSIEKPVEDYEEKLLLGGLDEET